MNQAPTTPSQEPKEIAATQVCREQPEGTGSQVSMESMETRVLAGGGVRQARREHLESPALQDSRAAWVLQVPRDAGGQMVSKVQKGGMVFLGLGVNRDQLETQDQPDVVALTDRRANQEIWG